MKMEISVFSALMVLIALLFLLMWSYLYVFLLIPGGFVIFVFITRIILKRKSAQTYLGIFTIGFFHPYSNAGGGGERVLWTAVRALQTKYGSKVMCVIYTADTNTTGAQILEKARQRFNITIQLPVHFVFLTKYKWLEAHHYRHFTLLCQSFGSLVTGTEALFSFIPDVYCDSMGFAFTLPLFRYFGGCKTFCYVHYPTITHEMTQRVGEGTEDYNNSELVAKNTFLTWLKICYYNLFAFIYGITGRCCSVVMVNSSWTYSHIKSLWKVSCTKIVYPPCDVGEFLEIPLQRNNRVRSVISVGQFRPEKDHPLQIKSFAKFLSQIAENQRMNYKLNLVGGCRGDEDISLVSKLKDLCSELDVEKNVEFKLNVEFSELKQLLAEAEIGLHTMWNEHFGIGVVECMAAGTIMLAHDSGGPKMDIVVPYNGKQTGFQAFDVDTYSDAMKTIFSLQDEDKLKIRKNARAHIMKFSEENFINEYLMTLEPIISVS